MRLAAGTHLGSYQIISPLGAGGMGEVFRAHDPRLNRDVALKVLPESMSKDPEGLARFAREARAVAALNHPHIVTIFSTEEADDVRFMTMELIEGRTLDRVISEGVVSLAEFFDVSIALADALSAAHQKQITHRDLKPSNVMVTNSGWVKVLDFGLARNTDTEGPGRSDLPSITRDGMIVGTAPYMSPEQIEAKPLDGRSDIFSMGVVMYELLSGRRPFSGDSGPAIMAAILRDDPRPVTDIRPAVPQGVEQIILRCLAKDPRDRPQDAHHLLRDLRIVRRVWEGMGAESRQESEAELKTIAGGVGGAARRPTSAPTKAPRVERGTSIAVLPFKDLSVAKDQSWLCEGIAEDILNDLARLEGLRVTPRDSAFAFAGTKDLRFVGTKLKTATLLTGSVRPIGDRVRIKVEFNDVLNGAQLWSTAIECDPADLLEVEASITKTIGEAFNLRVAPGQDSAVPTKAFVDSGAHRLYLKGRVVALKRGRHLPSALQHLQKAVEADPNYVPAWAGVAEVCNLLAYYGLVRPDQYRERAVSAAARAVEIDARSPRAHAALACSLLLYRGDPQRADDEFQTALQLSPNHSETRCQRALLFLQLTRGRHQEAIAEVRRALESDSHSLYVNTILGICFGISGQHDRALPLLRAVANADSDALLARHGLAHTLCWAGKFDEAASVIEGAARMSGYSGFGATMLVMVQARLGHLTQARGLLEQLRQRASSQYIALNNLAEASFAVGDTASAIALAEQALSDREPQFLLFARHAPNFEWLRKETVWPGMLKQLDGLGQATA